MGKHSAIPVLAWVGVFILLAVAAVWAGPRDIYGQDIPLQSAGSVSGWQFHEQTEVLTPGGIVDERDFSNVEPAAGDEDMPAIPVMDDVPVDDSQSVLSPDAYPDMAQPLEQPSAGEGGEGAEISPTANIVMPVSESTITSSPTQPQLPDEISPLGEGGMPPVTLVSPGVPAPGDISTSQ